jgi:hypothetical protein
VPFSAAVWCNVWHGLLSNNLTGPHVIEGRLTAPYGRNFRENELPTYLEDVPLASRGRMWLQNDGASPNFSREVKKLLKKL